MTMKIGFYKVILLVSLALSLFHLLGPVDVFAQQTDAALISPEIEAQLEALRTEIHSKGYRHSVGYNPAMERSLEELCGLVPPENWEFLAPWDDMSFERQFLRVLGLPQSFDWRDQISAPPVRNQGPCGSCWAFGTVGPLEFEISRQDGVLKDLSEQYLVSCNQWGYGCGGGWWAHDMHFNPGAVYESEFPYQASDLPCGGPYNYPYKIESWSYIGNAYSVPTPEQIKQAIYSYGPVSAAICVGYQFQAYTGGVFKTDLNCANHAVVLVGWDDTMDCDNGNYGGWILRNSWGPGWGEDGYMRICYDVSNVGYSANYVVYQSQTQQYDLTVSKTGTGDGTVISSPAGIDCGSDCSEIYDEGAAVTLTATPGDGSTFAGWTGGGCSGTGDCSVTMNADTTVTATFNTLPPPVASFMGEPPEGGAPHIVRFTDESQNTPTSWLWDFGDGSTSTDQNPVHIYSTEGFYTVSVIASNAGGSDTETRTDYVSVSSCSNSPVRIESQYYDTIESAYASASEGDTIELQAVDFVGPLTLNRDVSFTLNGGNNCEYGDNYLGTALYETLTIGRGAVAIKNLILQ